MILYRGEIKNNSEQEQLIADLYPHLIETLETQRIDVEKLMKACDSLMRKAFNHEYDEYALPLLEFAGVSYEKFIEYARMFSYESLKKRVESELGTDFNREENVNDSIRRRTAPLGTLLHIAAGNADILPAYSVIEGLLAGNINLLKLPTGDSGLSIKLLSEIIKEYPEIRDFVYVFDVPSVEIGTIKTLGSYADGIVIWGGDVAVKAVREFAAPNQKIIIYGHKLSFAYANGETTDQMLGELAKDICITNQLLCSSCQVLYYDTDDMDELVSFARRFHEILRKTNKALGKAPLSMRGKNRIEIYNDFLEGKKNIFTEDGVSVIVKDDSKLELSKLFRSVNIKRLPHEIIISTLKREECHLQTVGLLVPDSDERRNLEDLFIRAGITRITYGSMRELIPDEAHDGMFPLREYTKIVDVLR